MKLQLRKPSLILALFTGLNLLNYLDRFVLAAVLDPLEKDNHLSDDWAGGLATVFLVGYFATSPIFGRLADRGSRKVLIAIGVAVWSIGTIGTGLSHGLPTLVLTRILVGVGEASYATIAPTIIDDLAPPAQKARWLAIFYVATPLGSALGYVIGGAIASRYGWRAAFMVCGGPGLILALLCLFIVEPVRQKMKEHGSLVDDIKQLTRFPSYVHSVLGYAAYTFAVGGFALWAPTFCIRELKLDLGQATFRFGAVAAAAGIVGTALGGWLHDHFAAKLGGGDKAIVRAGLWICAAGSLAGAPFAIGCFLAPSSAFFFTCAFFCMVCLFLNSSPINAVILRSVPEERRAGAMALSITSIHVLGDLWSPVLIGLLMTDMHLPMRIAMMILPVAITISAVLFMPPRKKSGASGGDGVERVAA